VESNAFDGYMLLTKNSIGKYKIIETLFTAIFGEGIY
jgi:hypothetical protein